jgi:hypothetical protein
MGCGILRNVVVRHVHDGIRLWSRLVYDTLIPFYYSINTFMCIPYIHYTVAFRSQHLTSPRPALEDRIFSGMVSGWSGHSKCGVSKFQYA